MTGTAFALDIPVKSSAPVQKMDKK